MQFTKVAKGGEPLVPNPTGGFHEDGSKASARESEDPSVPTFSKQLDYVAVDGARDVERITERLVGQMCAEGLVSVFDGDEPVRVVELGSLKIGNVLDFQTVPNVKYRVVRERGRHCAHCDEKLVDDDNGPSPGSAVRAHVANEHAGEISPDPENENGYRCDNFVVMEKV